MESAARKKPLLCRLHLHQGSIDSAWFTQAELCNRCGEYIDPKQGAKLRLERELWGEVSGMRLSPEEERAYVRAHLHGTNLDLVPPRPNTSGE